MDEDIREEKRVDGPAAAESLDESGQAERLDESGQAERQLDRRTFIRLSALAGAAGVVASGCSGAGEPGGSAGYGGVGGSADPGGSGGDPEALAAGLEENVYTRLLGVRPHIGAHSHLSSMGGSRMPPEVMEAMAEANRFFVDMKDLHEAAGRRIAEIVGAEDALVSSGAFAALLVGAAGVLTGTDEERMEALPRPDWPKVECLFQTAHRFFYDKVFQYAGMTLVEADTRQAFEEAITDRTAMLVGLSFVERQNSGRPPFPAKYRQPTPPETLMPEEIIEIGRRKGVPVMIDMASDVHPISNFRRYIEAGADLVIVSGGKALRGPNSSGILAGRKDLIEAARMQNAPNNGIGRGLKVGKEEIIGLIAAVERYIALDPDAMVAAWNGKARWIADQLQDIPGLEANYEINTADYADVELIWDQETIPLSRADVDKALKEGSPSIIYYGEGICTKQFEDGEEVLVANRLRELFTTGS